MKKKQVNMKDIGNSPYFVGALLVILILVIIGIIVYFMMNIMATKTQLTAVRQSYAKNVNDIATLEQFRAENEKDEEMLAAYKNVLPDEEEDKYQVEEDIKGICTNFNLAVTVMTEPVESVAATKETAYNFTVTGEYKDIVGFIQYMTNLEAIHRVDAVNMSIDDSGVVTAVITIAVLTQQKAAK